MKLTIKVVAAPHRHMCGRTFRLKLTSHQSDVYNIILIEYLKQLNLFRIDIPRRDFRKDQYHVLDLKHLGLTTGPAIEYEINAIQCLRSGGIQDNATIHIKIQRLPTRATTPSNCSESNTDADMDSEDNAEGADMCLSDSEHLASLVAEEEDLDVPEDSLSQEPTVSQRNSVKQFLIDHLNTSFNRCTIATTMLNENRIHYTGEYLASDKRPIAHLRSYDGK